MKQQPLDPPVTDNRGAKHEALLLILCAMIVLANVVREGMGGCVFDTPVYVPTELLSQPAYPFV